MALPTTTNRPIRWSSGSPISSATVLQRARELSEAALRLELSYREASDGTAELLPEALTTARAIEDSDDRREFAWHARKRSMSFSWERTASMTFAFLAEVAGASAST